MPAAEPRARSPGLAVAIIALVAALAGTAYFPHGDDLADCRQVTRGQI